MKKRNIKIICRLLAATVMFTPAALAGMSMRAGAAAAQRMDKGSADVKQRSNTLIFDSNDSVITTATGIGRTIPRVDGLYDRNQYPIPLENKVPGEDVFQKIKAENKALMDNAEQDIKNGTLKKHVASDGQFYGNVPDDAPGVEKKIYINTNAKGQHSLASYVPAGEIATVTLNDEAMPYAKMGKIRITVGMTWTNADGYEHNHGEENRMPYLGKIFNINEKDTEVGTPFGGMVYIEIDDSVPSGLKVEVDIKGVVDTPYYDLGKTTKEEWDESRNAPGLFAEVRTPYLRFILPSKFIRDIDDLYDVVMYWNNAASLSSYVMGKLDRNKPMTLIFDPYITVGVAYAMPGYWRCNLPTSWGPTSLDFDNVMKNGQWGTMHEINHHYQRRDYSYSYDDEWGLGSSGELGEITNNVLSALSYMLYTNIAAYRGESGTDDWNKTADPYSSLKQQIFEGDEYYSDRPNMGNFMFSTFAHEIGPLNFAEVIKSTYDGGTFNGIEFDPYDYRAEDLDKTLTRDDRYDDMAYRLCAAAGRDYTWYMKKELQWPLKDSTVQKIKSHNFPQVVPVQSVYGMGEIGRETGRPFYIPASGYTFDIKKSIVTPGNVTGIRVKQPQYGTLEDKGDGRYQYIPGPDMPSDGKDKFILTVDVEFGGNTQTTDLNCTIGLDYNSSTVEKYIIMKWDIFEALEALESGKYTPYEVIGNSGSRIPADEGGDKLSRCYGYFTVDEDGEYEFQSYGDDKAAFEIYMDDGSKLQSVSNEYAPSAEKACELGDDATRFLVKLEAGKPYRYMLVCKNTGGAGWADVGIRKISDSSGEALNNPSWTSLDNVYSDLKYVGKNTDKSFELPKSEYVRPSSIAASNATELKGIKVISTPNGVLYNSSNEVTKTEGIKENMVDGDLGTYFHSATVGSSNYQNLPHEYVFDLGGEKSFNNVQIYARDLWPYVGVVGDYEIYVADEYNEDSTDWRLAASDHTRKTDENSPIHISADFNTETARYMKIVALNDLKGFNVTAIAEVKVTNTTNVKNVIAHDSDLIKYDGSWNMNRDGAYVNGGTYNASEGYFRYSFNGNESNIYVAEDAEALVRIDGGKWKLMTLTGSLREPSLTLNLDTYGNHTVEVMAVGDEIAVNMISTDGEFYKGSAAESSEGPKVSSEDMEIGIGRIENFDFMTGIIILDEDNTAVINDDVFIRGDLKRPEPGSSAESVIKYYVQDKNGNMTKAERTITVTDYLPEIKGAEEINIKKGASEDLRKGLTAEDHEDGIIEIKDIEIVRITNKQSEEEIDTDTQSADLPEGAYEVEYSLTDSDGNTVNEVRIINIVEELKDDADTETDKDTETDTDKDKDTETDKDDENLPDTDPEESKPGSGAGKPESGTEKPESGEMNESDKNPDPEAGDKPVQSPETDLNPEPDKNSETDLNPEVDKETDEESEKEEFDNESNGSTGSNSGEISGESGQPGSEEKPEVEGNPDLEGNPEIEGNLDADEKPEVEDDSDKEEKPGVEENPDTEKVPGADGTTEVEDKPDVEQTPDIVEKPETEGEPEKDKDNQESGSVNENEGNPENGGDETELDKNPELSEEPESDEIPGEDKKPQSHKKPKPDKDNSDDGSGNTEDNDDYKADSDLGNLNENNENNENQSEGSSQTVSQNTYDEGWNKAGDSWKFVKNGQSVKGWLKDTDGKWYYMNSTGIMHTGWLKDTDEKWYNLSSSGAMVTGWHKDTDDKWYHHEETGAMTTGWLKDNEKWYMLSSSGAMVTGWHKDTDGKWYHLKETGAMTTGWMQDTDGRWYYLKDSGEMAADEIINGYYVNSSGAWVR